MELKKGDNEYQPKSKQVDGEALILLLTAPNKKKLLCYHKWVYWWFDGGDRLHRVCTKCHKKQTNMDKGESNGIWKKDPYFP